MSKKNKNQQKQLVPLQQTVLLQEVQILQSERCSQTNINQSLLLNYIRNKLSGKKIQLNQQFVAIILGIQEQFKVVGFLQPQEHKQQVRQVINGTKEENGRGELEERNLKQKIFTVNNKTKLVLLSKSTLDLQKVQTWTKKICPPFFGVKQDYEKFKSAVVNALFHKRELEEIGLGAIKGILLSGFGGTGKSTFVKVLQSELLQKVSFRKIETFKLLHKYVGGAEEVIREIFEEAKQSLPVCLVFEDLHLIFSKNMKQDNQTTLAAILAEMDRIGSVQSLIVIGTYNSQRQIHDNLKHSGRFQKQFTLEIPRHHTRLQILGGLLSLLNLYQPIPQQEIKSLNLRMNGFSISQLQQIVREAFQLQGKKLSGETLQTVLKGFKPREIRELIVEVPEVRWSQIGGYQEVKEKIVQDIEWPLKRPEKFKMMGFEPMKGILLYGPPGCSKTMMAKAIATQSKLNFIGIKGPQLFSKYVGESQKAIRNIFKRARACSPCVIFFDEIDALGTQRSTNTDVADRVLTQLLNEMDGIEGLKEVIIVAATNRPYSLDPALLRPGRFDRLIYIGPPDVTARTEIFRIYLEKMPVENKTEVISLMAFDTENYTGAEIQLLCKEAAYSALAQNMEQPMATMENFKIARKKVRNRQTKESLLEFERFSERITTS